MSGAPTEAVIGQSRGCISQIGTERAKTSTKNLRGDLIIACGILGQLNLVYCVMNFRGAIMAAGKFHGVMTAASVKLSGWTALVRAVVPTIRSRSLSPAMPAFSPGMLSRRRPTIPRDYQHHGVEKPRPLGHREHGR